MFKVRHKVILNYLIVRVPIKSSASLYMLRKWIKILCNLRLYFYRNFLISLLEKPTRLLITFNSSRFLSLYFRIIVSFSTGTYDLSTRPVILDFLLHKRGEWHFYFLFIIWIRFNWFVEYSLSISDGIPSICWILISLVIK